MILTLSLILLFSGEGNRDPLQCPGLENFMDCIVHGGHKQLDMTKRFSLTIILYIFVFQLLFFPLAMLSGLQDPSSLTRDQTWAPVVEAWSPNHRTTREFPLLQFIKFCSACGQAHGSNRLINKFCSGPEAPMTSQQGCPSAFSSKVLKPQSAACQAQAFRNGRL